MDTPAPEQSLAAAPKEDTDALWSPERRWRWRFAAVRPPLSGAPFSPTFLVVWPASFSLSLSLCLTVSRSLSVEMTVDDELRRAGAITMGEWLHGGGGPSSTCRLHRPSSKRRRSIVYCARMHGKGAPDACGYSVKRAVMQRALAVHVLAALV